MLLVHSQRLIEVSMAKKIKRVVKRTLLIVGEGESEKAFLLHLRSLYSVGNPKVTVKSAGGKGPKNVIIEAISTKEATGYDSAIALLDTDLEWPIGLVKLAASKKVELFSSTPCFEGLLLDILKISRPTPNDSPTCKKKMQGLLNGPSTQRETYIEQFTRDVLDGCGNAVIAGIIEKIQGGSK